ncbi:hypothetical protein AVEN_246107-1 [Araneus ventricosus]|uniref:Uncharacterized protein n=1 Tax=Araneus ventricosus TaxID=182803 RepID=A0A4Y2P4U1_ARAVE|nr:hypothetical protein AVEN_246107-1 [Araneus ventricosus]
MRVHSACGFCGQRQERKKEKGKRAEEGRDGRRKEDAFFTRETPGRKCFLLIALLLVEVLPTHFQLSCVHWKCCQFVQVNFSFLLLFGHSSHGCGFSPDDVEVCRASCICLRRNVWSTCVDRGTVEKRRKHKFVLGGLLGFCLFGGAV